mgnify:CR=1 FL=1
MERELASLKDKLSDTERLNNQLKDKCIENDSLMARFAEDVRLMDVEVDNRKREQETLRGENRCLRGELEEMMQLKAKYDQTHLSLEEETARRHCAETEANTLREQLAELKSQSTIDMSNMKRALDDLRF